MYLEKYSYNLFYGTWSGWRSSPASARLGRIGGHQPERRDRACGNDRLVREVIVFLLASAENQVNAAMRIAEAPACATATLAPPR